MTYMTNHLVMVAGCEHLQHICAHLLITVQFCVSLMVTEIAAVVLAVL